MANHQTALHRHRNHFLFSDYYLAHRLTEQPEWATDAAAALAGFTALWRGYAPQADNESQTEADWIRPVLQRLGHHFNVQVALATPFGTRKPDYLLFAADADRQAAKAIAGPLNADHLRTGVLAVADAKAWDRDLDRAGAGLKTGQAISANPMVQIYVYVQHSGLPWGIVTNGRLWRLVHRDSADKLEVYYEVDLPALVEQGNADAFKFFWLFFRRQAFAAPAGRTPFLARVLAQSQAYNRGISDSLKGQVYEALRFLAQGFLDFPANRIDPTPGALHDIYTHSLIVLYRLLFILYAESRALLPVAGPQANSLYRDSYSLSALKRRIARELDQRKPVAASMDNDWHTLRRLWQVIDRGNADLGVPAYNGGLFDPQKHEFLSRYRVGDTHLRRAIDLLARTADPQTGRRRFVDYRDLEIRHLGSIYEGLLEYQLRRAETPLAVRVDKGREVYEPAPAGAPAAVNAGKLYLVTDKGERKASGSYYTPDFIVEYIVQQTVGPLLDDLAGRHKNDPAALERAMLRVNVLDPSMGSGHFLVEATHFIARRLVELGLPTPPDSGDSPDSDLTYWRRRVAQACIYGVDLNPLAVELAKLSLWLTTVARGKPLSFLDHHLRHGNSLIGSRVAELPLKGAAQQRRRRKKQQQAEAAQRAAGQMSMLDDSAFVSTMRTATGFMGDIEQLRGETLAEVQEAAGLYQKIVTEVTANARQLANLHTARAFGLELADDLWPHVARYLTHGGLPFARFDQLAEQAAALTAQHHFFHWELEFPEVFFDEHGRLDAAAGFDAVIGNPPYVRQEELSPLKPWFAEAFPEVYAGTADLFVYFFGQGLKLLRRGGRLSYISSNSWLRANYATALRQHLREQTTVETLLDLGDNRVFADAPDLYPSIHIVRNQPPKKEHTAQVAVFNRGEGLADFAAQVPRKLSPVTIHDQPDSGWQLDDAGRGVFAKLMQHGAPLAEVVDGQMYRGVLTGLNAAFIIDGETRQRLIAEDARSAEIIKPLVNGADVRSWHIEDEDRWLIFSRRGIDINGYPAIKEHLQLYRQQLEPRPKDWSRGKKWLGRKPGTYEWYEIQDSVDYHAEFEGWKIFWPEMGKVPRFVLAEPGVFGNKTTFMIPGQNFYLLGILMTRVTWFAISRLCVPIGERGGLLRYTLSAQFMSQLPIPDAPAAERDAIGDLALRLTDIAKSRYQLHRQSRHRILSDLRTPAGKDRLNQKLTAWWALDFAAFRREVKKQFKRDIPLNERDEWEAWLLDRQARHQQHTQQIIALETELNARVYGLFNLTPAEIALIEESTKYRYGEV